VEILRCWVFAELLEQPEPPKTKANVASNMQNKPAKRRFLWRSKPKPMIGVKHAAADLPLKSDRFSATNCAVDTVTVKFAVPPDVTFTVDGVSEHVAYCGAPYRRGASHPNILRPR
jgi:hypothetical protein